MPKSEDWDLAHQILSAFPSAVCAMCVNDLLQSWVVAVHIMYQIAFSTLHEKRIILHFCETAHLPLP